AVWRRAEGERLEEPNYAPPEEIFQWTKSPMAAKDQVQELRIDFKNGVPVAIDGISAAPASLIMKMNEIAGNNGIGRIDIMEDRMLGLKVRENYECPAAVVLLAAHKAMEALVLTAGEIRMKQRVDAEWASLAYQGLWFDPLKDDLEAFIQSTQKRVSGTVTLRLYKGNLSIIGRESPWALYSEDLASFDTTTFDQRESTGMVKNFGMQQRMFFALVEKHKQHQ
ncbi:MAG: argininosuccinate synthase, partial [Methylotenera sp.]|nr:argininosuccinate synthase [Oligoflexia bacterium]